MKPRLLLDECVSPNMSSALWAKGIDNYATRDRGLQSSGDHALFARAIQEERAIVTINDVDFRKVAGAAAAHSGVVVIPNGGTRAEQLAWVMRAIAWAEADDSLLSAFKNRIVYVAENGSIAAETVHAGAPPAKPKGRV